MTHAKPTAAEVDAATLCLSDKDKALSDLTLCGDADERHSAETSLQCRVVALVGDIDRINERHRMGEILEDDRAAQILAIEHQVYAMRKGRVMRHTGHGKGNLIPDPRPGRLNDPAR